MEGVRVLARVQYVLVAQTPTMGAETPKGWRIMTIEYKAIDAGIKQAGEDGSFEAVIATLGVVDRDGDIVEPGAFGNATVHVLPAHDSGSVSLGKAQIVERGNLAIAVGQFNMEIQKAVDWSSSLRFDLKHPPSIQQWSWGFVIEKDSRDTIDGDPVRRLIDVDTFEISPVVRAASVGTGTLSAKSEGGEPLPLVEQIKGATGTVAELVARIREIAEGRREKDGRGLGPEVRIATVEMAEECSKLLDELAATIEKEVLPDPEVSKAAARWLAMEATRVGVEL